MSPTQTLCICVYCFIRFCIFIVPGLKYTLVLYTFITLFMLFTKSLHCSLSKQFTRRADSSGDIASHTFLTRSNHVKLSLLISMLCSIPVYYTHSVICSFLACSMCTKLFRTLQTTLTCHYFHTNSVPHLLHSDTYVVIKTVWQKENCCDKFKLLLKILKYEAQVINFYLRPCLLKSLKKLL